MTCHPQQVKFIVLAVSALLLITGCSNEVTSFPAPPQPPNVAPPFDEALAEQELNDETAANTDQHSDDELMEFEPGLATDPAALKSAFYTGSEDLCAAVFAQLGGSATVGGNQVSIDWCRDIAAKLSVPATATDEAQAHAAGWTNTRAAIFTSRTQLCAGSRCVTLSSFPYPF
jgi:hypothetical protein